MKYAEKHGWTENMPWCHVLTSGCGVVKDVRTLIEQGDPETARVIDNIRLLHEKLTAQEEHRKAAQPIAYPLEITAS